MTDQELRARLQGALVPSMRARDAAAVSAIRSALAAVANAEAVPVEHRRASLTDGPVAGTVGVGAAEAPRRVLADGEVRALVEAEVAERRAAADQLVAAGREEAAGRLHAEAAALTRLL